MAQPSRELVGHERSQIPSRLQAVIVWLMSMAIVVGIGLGVGVVAAVLALRSGLSFDRALALISDPRTSPLVTSSTWIAISIATSELGVLLTLLFWMRRQHAPLGPVFPIGKPTWRGFVGALVVVFGFAPLAELAGELANRALPREVTAEHVVTALASGASDSGIFGVLFAAALMPALVEEAMFRGLITRAFEKRSHAEMILVPSFMFGIFHLEPTQVAGTVVLGVAFGLARLYSGSLLPSMVAHAIYNAAVILEVRFGLRVEDHMLHFGRVAIGLGVGALGTFIMVSAPGHHPLRRSSWLPPPH